MDAKGFVQIFLNDDLTNIRFFDSFSCSNSKWDCCTLILVTAKKKC